MPREGCVQCSGVSLISQVNTQKKQTMNPSYKKPTLYIYVSNKNYGMYQAHKTENNQLSYYKLSHFCVFLFSPVVVVLDTS